MAVPKHKISKSKRDKRRTHQKPAVPNVIKCPQCGGMKLPHRACPECGAYKGRAVILSEE